MHVFSRFICDCIEKVKEKGYSVFGLQFYGECWSGAMVSCTYQKFGQTKTCVNENMAQCKNDGDLLCSGNSATATYVYILNDTPVQCSTSSQILTSTKQSTYPPTTSDINTQPKTTPRIMTSPKTTKDATTIPQTTSPGPPQITCGTIKYQLIKLGCWKELGRSRQTKVLPELLLTSTNGNSNVYAGYEYTTGKYSDFLRRLVTNGQITKYQTIILVSPYQHTVKIYDTKFYHRICFIVLKRTYKMTL